MKAVLSFFRIVISGTSASVTSALLFYLFLLFLLAHHIHISNYYFKRESALNMDTLYLIYDFGII